MWLPTTHTITPQATLTHKPAALKQAPRSPVVDPDERVHAIDLILSVSPPKYCGHGLAHQSLAPVRLRQVKRQLRPAVYLGVVVKTAGADKLIIVLESDPPIWTARPPPNGSDTARSSLRPSVPMQRDSWSIR